MSSLLHFRLANAILIYYLFNFIVCNSCFGEIKFHKYKMVNRRPVYRKSNGWFRILNVTKLTIASQSPPAPLSRPNPPLVYIQNK